ncbi:TonB-dependent receptor [Porticoccaceae bacterium]|nr:TonB-dependent receptor [Porticoccaceae bacterium]MDA8599268.1 TonB-dependent receptor [Porticoccaceae bacterium]MDA8878497.1 TonB-dependent receptor [Porticoccaceae bacterium]MDB2396023.1 TonB-dependent receptor [Porticoccaceae bacterium]MDB2558132.1 TonB-dependent receptor [Porticoccaceae bacterium]
MNLNKHYSAAFALAVSSFSAQVISDTNAEIEEVLVSASLIPITASRSANAVTVIDRAQLRNRATVSLSNILRDVPGFSVSQVGVLGSQTQIRVRGAEANHLLVTIDGVEANDPSQGDEFSWGTLTASDIERIEIIRGPQSSLRGSDAVAGVVNIITRSAEKSSVGLFLESGSWATHHSGFNIGYKQGDFDIRFGLSHIESEGDNIARRGDENDGYRNTTYNIRSGLKLSDQIDISFAARESDGMNQFDADNDFDGLIEDQDRVSEFENSTMRFQGDYSSKDGTWQHKVLISQSKSDNNAFADKAKGNVTASTKDQIQYIGSFTWDQGAQNIAALVEREKEDWMQRGEITWGVYDPNQDRERDTDSVAVEYRTDINDHLTLAASARHDDNSEFDSAKTYRAEAIYQLTEAIRLRGAVGTAVKNPTFTERFGFYTNFIGNPNLIPEESTSWELGADQLIMGGALTLSLTIFEAELENEIDGFVYDPATFAYTSSNINGTSERKGAELSAVGNISESMSLSAAYTYTDSTGDDAVREVRRPRHIASLNLGWQAAHNLHLNTNIQFTGEQTDVYFPPFPEPSQVVALSNHTLVNINLNYSATEKFEMYLKLENALNENYEEVFGYQTLGFGASLGLRYSM